MTEEKSSIFEHLGELRKRAIICVVATFIGMVAAYSLYDPWILNLIKGPLNSLGDASGNPFVLGNPLVRFLKSSLGGGSALNLKLHFIGPMEVFMVKIKASFFAGAAIASPVISFQVWSFVAAGLKEKERKSVHGFMFASFVLFLVGALIAYFVMLPIVLYFLVVVVGRGLEPMLVLSKYVSLVVLCCLAFGIVFEMPLVILFLTKLGIVTPNVLMEKRKYAILLMFVLAALLTPPDIVTQGMMVLPMIVLYEGSIWVSKWTWARRQKELGG